MEADRYYEAHDPKKVKQFYKILLNKKVLANGKNLNIAVRKIVLAVRVYLKHPDLLLLDEDFLTIDKFRKTTIYDKFWSMNSTVVSILSNMENILLYDRVYILDNGRVMEEGNPKFLIQDKRSKLYKRLLQCDQTVFRKIMQTHTHFQIDTGALTNTHKVNVWDKAHEKKKPDKVSVFKEESCVTLSGYGS